MVLNIYRLKLLEHMNYPAETGWYQKMENIASMDEDLRWPGPSKT
jgi:hypothetical protein